jgi:NADPH:quinone reductase-like Zn-dependent oxidoreductase
MQTEFRAIVQSEYGAPEKVLRIARRQLKSEELGADDVLVKVIARPIHLGDIQILSALPSRRTGRAHSGRNSESTWV